MKDEILFITSYPPRECGIATYSQDLLVALNNKFKHSFSLRVCALEASNTTFLYPKEVKYTFNTEDGSRYWPLSQKINADDEINLVLIQHEFGFFQRAGEKAFLQFLYGLTKPAMIIFHTVLPSPDEALRNNVRAIANAVVFMVVMTKNARQVLSAEYGVSPEKIIVIPHGTHLVPHLNNDFLKNKYGLNGRKVLSTFGLLSSGKGIETTLEAMPGIIEHNPDVIFLVMGKTHPSVLLEEGETYRNMLEARVEALELSGHVKFINQYLPLHDLLEYLQLTDIYLFTSKDPNQAVSGTFSYAMSCACPIISTPIPHAREVLRDDTGIIFDFQDAGQLAAGVNRLLNDDTIRAAFSANTLHRIVPTAWENSAIAHALLFQKIIDNSHSASPSNGRIALEYRIPAINLDHLKKMTTTIGIIQFSKINQPDLDSGYTLDDNARALIAMCMHFELSEAEEDLALIQTYLDFVAGCQQSDGGFLNYVDQYLSFTPQNESVNLSDSNGRAIWALGFVISKFRILPRDIILQAESILQRALPRIEGLYSTRAMAFAIKGLYYWNIELNSTENSRLITTLANRLVQMFRHESEPDWQWFESYLTYANSILPEAMLCAWLDTGTPVYQEVARMSFNFLKELTFNGDNIKVISNKSWHHKGSKPLEHGEQPIDVAYTILALDRFYDAYGMPDDAEKMISAFNWFLGNNHLQQIIYNPCTGGCYDGLEENHVNLNQGAESTLSYLMARLAVEQHNLVNGLRAIHFQASATVVV